MIKSYDSKYQFLTAFPEPALRAMLSAEWTASETSTRAIGDDDSRVCPLGLLLQHTLDSETLNELTIAQRSTPSSHTASWLFRTHPAFAEWRTNHPDNPDNLSLFLAIRDFINYADSRVLHLPAFITLSEEEPREQTI